MTQNQEKEIKAKNSKDPKMSQMLERADKNLQRDMKYLFKNLKEDTVCFLAGVEGGMPRGCRISARGAKAGPCRGSTKS